MLHLLWSVLLRLLVSESYCVIFLFWVELASVFPWGQRGGGGEDGGQANLSFNKKHVDKWLPNFYFHIPRPGCNSHLHPAADNHSIVSLSRIKGYSFQHLRNVAIYGKKKVTVWLLCTTCTLWHPHIPARTYAHHMLPASEQTFGGEKKVRMSIRAERYSIF